jgi:hypothetical protein
MKKNNEREWLKRKKFTDEVSDSELRAIRRCMNIESMGYQITHESIRKELKITREAMEREQQKAVALAAELKPQMEGTDLSLITQLRDAGFGEDGRL